MNKRESRIEILDLQDKHCRECNRRNVYDSGYCWDHCDIGKRINDLGIYLGGQKAQNKKKLRTKLEWDEICIKAISMKDDGIKYIEIAKKFNVSYGHFRKQLNKRNMKK
ncbi:hypothetical protein M3644_26715 [Bacillus cereus]|uniref:hypothetical protein n=1 Tax=Bacillus cereus TaxID=1396 RepID=UPI002041BA92|nr:hypothetical protein [Bacillus cereus]MCM3223347.1 hypothetical protein [Bacillus cereus]